MATKPDGRKRRGKKARGTGAASPRSIRAAQRRAEAIEYRLQGYSYEQIGQTMGFSDTRAFQLVDEGLQAIKTEVPQSLKDLEAKRLDMLLAAFMASAVQGDLNAAKMVVSIMERRAKLFGLDGPIKHELTGKDGKPIETEAKITPESARGILFDALKNAGLVLPQGQPEGQNTPQS